MELAITYLKRSVASYAVRIPETRRANLKEARVA